MNRRQPSCIMVDGWSRCKRCSRDRQSCGYDDRGSLVFPDGSSIREAALRDLLREVPPNLLQSLSARSFTEEGCRVVSSESLETAITTIREDIAACSDRPELIATLRAVEMQFLRSLNHLQVAGTLLESLHAVAPERIGVHFFPAYHTLQYPNPYNMPYPNWNRAYYMDESEAADMYIGSV